jgi:methylmalonyl-CoA mutase N-terminal domain/subunit
MATRIARQDPIDLGMSGVNVIWQGDANALALAALERAAGSTAPLMPVIVEAVRARATLGEISDVLRGVWGRYAA